MRCVVLAPIWRIGDQRQIAEQVLRSLKTARHERVSNMAQHGTLLFAYGNANDLILAADGRSVSAKGEFNSDESPKLALCGNRGACAVGGFCEGIVKNGPRAGWHWKLLDDLARATNLPTRSFEDRAEFMFQLAYNSAAEYLPHDSDPGDPGVNPKGITVLYGEVSRMSDVHLFRADLPVTVIEDSDLGWTWSVERSVTKPIFPGSVSVQLPFLYLHNPEILEHVKLSPSPDDAALAGSLETVFQLFTQKYAPQTVGGKITAIRIDKKRARWVVR